MSLRDDAERLARRTEAALIRLYGRKDDLTDEQFVRLAAVILTSARIRGVMLADLSLANEIRRSVGGRTPPIGLAAPTEDFERLQGSVRTVLDTDVETATTPEEKADSIRARLARLGRDAPAEAVAYGMKIAMTRRAVGGWIRQTDSDPCKVCSNLADGVVRPPSVTMLRHTGCMCVPQPII